MHRRELGLLRPPLRTLLLLLLLLLQPLAAMLIGAGCASPETKQTADTAPPSAASLTGAKGGTGGIVDLGRGVTVDRSAREVRVQAVVVLEEGWLEQVVCLEGTREHESVLVTPAPASLIHAGLLAIGLEPGSPGRWERIDGDLDLVPPSGDAVDVDVVDPRTDQRLDVEDWMMGEHGETFRGHGWKFAGSILDQTGYAADSSGSIVGLVTFGDETLAFTQVLPDQIDVQPPLWQIRTAVIPPPGTRVVLVLSPA